MCDSDARSLPGVTVDIDVWQPRVLERDGREISIDKNASIKNTTTSLLRSSVPIKDENLNPVQTPTGNLDSISLTNTSNKDDNSNNDDSKESKKKMFVSENPVEYHPEGSCAMPPKLVKHLPFPKPCPSGDLVSSSDCTGISNNKSNECQNSKQNVTHTTQLCLDSKFFTHAPKSPESELVTSSASHKSKIQQELRLPRSVFRGLQSSLSLPPAGLYPTSLTNRRRRFLQQLCLPYLLCPPQQLRPPLQLTIQIQCPPLPPGTLKAPRCTKSQYSLAIYSLNPFGRPTPQCFLQLQCMSPQQWQPQQWPSYPQCYPGIYSSYPVYPRYQQTTFPPSPWPARSTTPTFYPVRSRCPPLQHKVQSKHVDEATFYSEPACRPCPIPCAAPCPPTAQFEPCQPTQVFPSPFSPFTSPWPACSTTSTLYPEPPERKPCPLKKRRRPPLQHKFQSKHVDGATFYSEPACRPCPIPCAAPCPPTTQFEQCQPTHVLPPLLPPCPSTWPACSTTPTLYSKPPQRKPCPATKRRRPPLQQVQNKHVGEATCDPEPACGPCPLPCAAPCRPTAQFEPCQSTHVLPPLLPPCPSTWPACSTTPTLYPEPPQRKSCPSKKRRRPPLQPVQSKHVGEDTCDPEPACGPCPIPCATPCPPTAQFEPCQPSQVLRPPIPPLQQVQSKHVGEDTCDPDPACGPCPLPCAAPSPPTAQFEPCQPSQVLPPPLPPCPPPCPPLCPEPPKQPECRGREPVCPPPACDPCAPIPLNPCCPRFPVASPKKYRMIFLIMLPIIIGHSVYCLTAPHCPKVPCRDFEYMRIRRKRFPWGDGNASFFHNDHVNHLPDQCELPPLVCVKVPREDYDDDYDEWC